MEKKSYTEGILSEVDATKETSGDCYKRNSTNTFTDQGAHSDRSKDRQDRDDFKSYKNELSVAEYTDSGCTNVGWKLDENETSPLSYYQMVSETDCAISTTQEAACTSIQTNQGQDIHAPTTEARLAGQLNSEDKSDELDVIPTVNVVTNDNEKKNASVLVGSKIDQTVVKCLQELIDHAVSEEIGVESLLSLDGHQKANKEQKEPKTSHKSSSDDQSDFENLSGPSSQSKVHTEKRPEVSTASKKSIRKCKQLRTCRNYLDQLSIIIDEVQRMNEYYMKDFMNKSKEVDDIDNALTHVTENLSCLYDLPSTDIDLYDDEGLPCAAVNVVDYGLKLHEDIQDLQTKSHQFMDVYNENRLHFLNMSREFLFLPLENVMGRAQKIRIESVLESSRILYSKFFLAEIFDSKFQVLKSDNKVLKEHVDDFNNLIDMLAEHRNNEVTLT